MYFYQSMILVGETDSEKKIILAGKNAGWNWVNMDKYA